MTATETKIKDSKAHLSILAKQIEDARLELNDVLSQRDSLLAERAAFNKEKEDYYASIKADETRKSTENEAHAKEIIEKKENIVQLSKEEASLQSRIKAAIKELSRINDYCLSGHTEAEKLDIRRKEVEQEIRELTELVLHKEATNKDVVALRSLKDSLLIEFNKLKEQCIEEVRRSSELVAKLNNEAQEAIMARDLAQHELKEYTDKLYTAMNDWMVIRTRLETVFKTHYPELELPLAM